MSTSANSPSWIRTYTRDDATKYQIAYRSNNTWRLDAKGKAVPGSFTTNLQVDRTAIDGGVTGGGVNATWTTAATRGPGARGVWERKYLDDADTTLGFALPDASWSDLNNRNSNFNSQVNNISANAIAKYFRTLGFGRGSGVSTQEGAIRELSRSQGSNNQGSSSEDTISGTNIKTLAEEAGDRPREKYGSRYTYYYPVALKTNSDQDKLAISVLEYKPRPINKTTSGDKTTLGIGEREGYRSRTLGSVFLPVPGNVSDNNSVSWDQDTMDPAKLLASNAFFSNVTKGSGAIDGLADTLGEIGVSIGENSGGVKEAVAGALAKAATGGSILTRATGKIINPNMELLFKGPQMRTFQLSWKMSPRDYAESEMIKKIIRMFKQSMAVKRTESQVFLKSPNTYKLRYLTARKKEHSFLPKIKECALVGCSINYTPDGNYQVYENSSMVAYQMTLSFNELEPIYHDDYTKLDQDRDESVGF